MRLREHVQDLRYLLDERKAFPLGTKRTWKGGEYEKVSVGGKEVWLKTAAGAPKQIAKKTPTAPKTHTAPSSTIKPPEPTAVKKLEPIVTPDLKSDISGRSVFTQGLAWNDKGEGSYSKEAQAAIRQHFTKIAGKYGMRQRDLPDVNKIDLVEHRAMGGAAAQFNDEGGIRFSSYTAQMLRTHGETADLSKTPRYFADAVLAYCQATHESTHGHGPYIPYEGHGILTDEVATEVTARRMAADVHGIRTTEEGLYFEGRQIGSYESNISDVIVAIQKASGQDDRAAYKALEEASFDLKRMEPSHKFSDGDSAIQHMSKLIAARAGVTDSKKLQRLHRDIVSASDKLIQERAARGRSV